MRRIEAPTGKAVKYVASEEAVLHRLSEQLRLSPPSCRNGLTSCCRKTGNWPGGRAAEGEAGCSPGAEELLQQAMEIAASRYCLLR